MRRATLGTVLAWTMATGCTGDDASTAATLSEAPPGTSDALVELPPAPVLTIRSVPTSTEALPLGPWDWGAPCRVAAREVIGTRGPQVSRMFTVDVAVDASQGGYVMSFDDVVELDTGLTEEYVAGALYRNLAVLPDMRLDADGRFVEFVDLEAELTESARRADVASTGDVVAIVARQPVVTDSILDRTILAWFGFWLDHDVLAVNPDRHAGQRTRQGPAGPQRWSTETFAADVVGERDGRAGNSVVWLTHTEQAIDSATGRIDASAIVDPTDRRPSYVVLTIDGFSSGELAVFAEQDRRVVTFDWGTAEGCE